jgi:RNA polymerase sigma factor (TIGR02999 family)
MEYDASEPTQLLRRASAGEAPAAEALFRLVQGELVRVARSLMSGERTGHTLQATALVNEAWLRLFRPGSVCDWMDRAHFLRTAATAMRHVLVDHARARSRDKRGSGRMVIDAALDELAADGGADVVALHEALERFARIDVQGARIVELRFFAGLSIDETARVLGVSTPTVERGWRTARLWLARALDAQDQARRVEP